MELSIVTNYASRISVEVKQGSLDKQFKDKGIRLNAGLVAIIDMESLDELIDILLIAKELALKPSKQEIDFAYSESAKATIQSSKTKSSSLKERNVILTQPFNPNFHTTGGESIYSGDWIANSGNAIRVSEPLIEKREGLGFSDIKEDGYLRIERIVDRLLKELKQDITAIRFIPNSGSKKLSFERLVIEFKNNTEQVLVFASEKFRKNNNIESDFNSLEDIREFHAYLLNYLHQ